jgi:hypothetical protein
LPTTLNRTRPRREVKNTYKLPEGRQLRLALRGWFREQRKAVLAWLRTGQIERKDEGGGLFDMPEWDAFGMDAAELADRMIDGARAIFEDVGRRAWEGFRRVRGWLPKVWPTAAQDPIVDKIVRDVSREINKTTREKIRDAIGHVREEIAAGTIDPAAAKDEIAADLGRIFDEAEQKRARRIAETEASRIAHEAQYQAGKESGLVTGWRWLANEDACPVCVEIEAECKFVPMGRPFAFIGDNIDYMMIMHPPAHPFCKCSLAEVMITDDQPEWGETLIDPDGKPETDDDPAQEL